MLELRCKVYSRVGILGIQVFSIAQLCYYNILYLIITARCAVVFILLRIRYEPSMSEQYSVYYQIAHVWWAHANGGF